MDIYRHLISPTILQKKIWIYVIISAIWFKIFYYKRIIELLIVLKVI